MKLSGDYQFVRVYGGRSGDNSILERQSAATIMVWVKRENDGIIYSERRQRKKQCGGSWAFVLHPTKFKFFDGRRPIDYSLDYEPPMNKWYHYAATFDGPTAKFYINGKLKKTFKANFGFFDNCCVFLGGAWTCGSRLDGPYFKGSLDELKIYDSKFSDSQIKNEYNANKANV